MAEVLTAPDAVMKSARANGRSACYPAARRHDQPGDRCWSLAVADAAGTAAAGTLRWPAPWCVVRVGMVSLRSARSSA
jgi:hypothetical protein